ncbi:hypothetical protein AB0H69_25335 [Streptomyces phaeochromogenes]|uniref:hypothetical protein n=1 Tax=Streptomyces phaeochromogenes TaxID=1923 RepID=UPI0033D25BAF
MSSNASRTALIELRGDTDSDLEELESLTLELRERLLELDVDGVDPVQQETVPAGTKVGGALTAGALIVAVGLPALRMVLDLLKTWIENRPVRTVSVTIGENALEIQAVSSADQRRLIETFIAANDSTASSLTDSAPRPRTPTNANATDES